MTGVTAVSQFPTAEGFVAKWTEEGVKLKWTTDGNEYAIFRAKDSQSDYTFIGKGKCGEFIDKDFSPAHKARLTYKLTSINSETGKGGGALAVLHPADALETKRYTYRYKINNINIQKRERI